MRHPFRDAHVMLCHVAAGGVLHGGDLLILLLDVPLLLDSPPANGAPVAQGRVAAAGQLQTSSLLEQVGLVT